MKKIGSGWTYDVYRKEENKVLKIKKPFLKRVFRIIISDPRELLHIKKTIHKLDVQDKKSFSIIERLIKTSFDFNQLANPIILAEGVYEQDFCSPIYLFLGYTEKIKDIVDSYIEQIKYFWGYGFADTVFNFTVNNGLDKNGNIILIDFNEITQDKKHILVSIKNQIWRKRFSVNNHLNSGQKKYFLQKMSQELTEENLDKYWKKSL